MKAIQWWLVLSAVSTTLLADELTLSQDDIVAVLMSEATTPKFFASCKRLFDENGNDLEAEKLNLTYQKYRDRQNTVFENANIAIRAAPGNQIETGTYFGYYSQMLANELSRFPSERQWLFCREFVELLDRKQFDSGSFPTDAFRKFFVHN